MCACEEIKGVAKASTSNDGQPSARLRRGEGRAQGGRGELILVAQVAFDEVDATPQATQFKPSLLLVVPVAFSRGNAD